MKYRTSKDWATTILADLEELKLNVTIAEIKSIRRGTYMNMIRKSIRENTFEKLNMKQSSHSKVNKWKHTMFKMQNYLMPNRAMMTQEDCQFIFKLRCRVTKIKTNLKGLFDTHECGACGQEEETQEHIIKCTKLRSMNTDNSEHPEYEKLFNGKVKDQLFIARTFKQNMKRMETLKDN